MEIDIIWEKETKVRLSYLWRNILIMISYAFIVGLVGFAVSFVMGMVEFQ